MAAPDHFRTIALGLCAAGLVATLAVPCAQAATGKQAVMNTYRSMMARKCQIKPKKPDIGASVFPQNIRLSEKWIRIRHVQKGWKGWVRVHAVCRVPGGTAWGYADLQLKSGEVICESDNWDSMITPMEKLGR